MKKNKLLLVLGLTCTSIFVHAQDWVSMMQDPKVNFYDVQKAFNAYWVKTEKKNAVKVFFGGKESQVAEENYEKYKRWEYYMEQRVYPTGDRSLIQKGAEEIKNKIVWNKEKSMNATAMVGNWTLLGATSQIPNGGGAGRLNCITFDPASSQNIFVGAPSGGLWTSTNAGLSWATNTDHLAVMGASDIAVDPTNSSIQYLGTGDRDASDSYSIGVLKSTDGGITWNPSGLNFNITDNRQVYQVLINPANHNMIFAATSMGLYKSLDAGVTWVKTLSGGVRDVKFKPTDPTVMYAVTSTNYFRSTNTGSNFTLISTGLPSPISLCRLAIAVTPADPTYVYILGANASGYTYKGVYRSTDQGVTFTAQSTSPNLLGFAPDGSDNQGQGWYTLSIAASPTNKNEIVVGGVNIWRSTDGGVSWVLNADWTGSFAPYVHADIHQLIYLPGSGTNVYAVCDGGIFQTPDNGNTWNDLSNGLGIGEMYRLGVSQSNANITIQGWQDNGTNEDNAGTWRQVMGGDGMECFVDYTNTNYMFGETYNGGLQRSTNGGNSFHGITNGISGSGAWVTPWCMDPQTPSTIYAGFQEVWKSTNRGTAWTQISHFGGSSLTTLAVAPSNNQYIYAGDGSSLQRTTNGGTTWTNITGTLPGSTAMTYVGVSTTNPNKVWITYSGYTANSKVFKSEDGGNTWVNLSATLPNLPVNCVVNQTGTPDGVYIGTDVGVYYTDTTMTGNWVFFSAGLPNVNVHELEIQVSSGKLRAATYGRGLWETSLYNPTSNLPLANFVANTTNVCPGNTVQFTDMSTNGPTTWNWSFPGGTPSSSTVQNPLITYNTPGSFNMAKLTVTNSNGTDSVTKYSYIGVSPLSPASIFRTGNDTICQGAQLILAASYGNSYSWSPGGTGNSSISPSSTGTYTVYITDGFGCIAMAAPMHVVINPLPTPIITFSGDTLFSNYTHGNQWFLGTTAITGATATKYLVTHPGNYTVQVTDSNGCTGSSNMLTSIREGQGLNASVSVYPNPGDGHFTLSLDVKEYGIYQVRVTDLTGRVILTEQITSGGAAGHEMDLSGFGQGMYLLDVTGPQGNAVKKLFVE
jgi:PKD repeat protein